MPRGYNGPAFLLKDGRTLYVGRYLGRSWGTMFLNADRHAELYMSPVMPLVEDKQTARANLIAYATDKGLRKGQ